MQTFINEFNQEPTEFAPDGTLQTYENRYRLIYPGSFNPLHSQHVAIMLHAMKHYGIKSHININCKPDVLSPVFEISKSNCDKPDVTDEDLIERIKTITSTNFNVVVTRTPKFSQKNHTFNHSRYILGLDTFLRMIDIKYHYNNFELMCRNLMRGRNEYLVYPRGISDAAEWNHIITNIATMFKDESELCSRFIFVNLAKYQVSDMSSTELRSKKSVEL